MEKISSLVVVLIGLYSYAYNHNFLLIIGCVHSSLVFVHSHIFMHTRFVLDQYKETFAYLGLDFTT